MSVIQFDAHSDLWTGDDIGRIDQGTFMYKAVKLGLVYVKRPVHIGNRSDCNDYLGMPYIDARAVQEKGTAYVIEKVKQIGEKLPTYWSFDIDALNTAFAPRTSTPVWGSLAGINMVGGGIVEVSATYDTTGATAIVGAHIAMKLCCLGLWNRRNFLRFLSQLAEMILLIFQDHKHLCDCLRRQVPKV